MFWGIILEAGKKYSQTLQRSFCVTMATLGFKKPSDGRVYVVVQVNNTQYVLCSLQFDKLPQQALNLNFTEGEEVSFFLNGEGEVHLTGFLTPDETDSDLSSDDDEEEVKIEMKGNVLLQKDLEHDESLMSAQGLKNVNDSEVKCSDHSCVISNGNVSEVKSQGILSVVQEMSGSTDDEEKLEKFNVDPETYILLDQYSKKVNDDAVNLSHRITIVDDVKLNIDAPTDINGNRNYPDVDTLSSEDTQLADYRGSTNSNDLSSGETLASSDGSDQKNHFLNTRYKKTHMVEMEDLSMNEKKKYGTKRTRSSNDKSKSDTEMTRSRNEDKDRNKSDSDIKKKENRGSKIVVKCDKDDSDRIKTKNRTRQKKKKIDTEIKSKEDNSTLTLPTRTLRKRK